MKRFRFRFAAVEKVRKVREEDALRRLADARRVHGEAVSALDCVLAERDRAFQRRDMLSAGGAAISAAELSLESHFISTVRYRIQRHQMSVTRAARGVEKALRMLLLARRDTMVIDRIREKDLERFRTERRKWEMKQMDEMASLRFTPSPEIFGSPETGEVAS